LLVVVAVMRPLSRVVYVKSKDIMSYEVGTGIGFQHKYLGESVWRIIVALQSY